MNEGLLIVLVVLVSAFLAGAGIALGEDLPIWRKSHPVKVSDFKRRLRRFFGRRGKNKRSGK